MVRYQSILRMLVRSSAIHCTFGSCQKKVQRDFEKPSFEEKTRFLAHALDSSGTFLHRSTFDQAHRQENNQPDVQ